MIHTDYYKSKGAICRMVAVCVGLIGMALFAVTRDKGYYYHGFQDHCTLSNYQVCPETALFILALVLAILCWLLTVVLLIVKIVLNNPSLQKLDFIGQIVAGVGYILAFLLSLGFVVMVFFTNFPCQEYTVKYNRYERRSDPKNNANGRVLSSSVYETYCAQTQLLYYMTYHVIFGCIFALIAGVFCCVASCLEKKGGRFTRNDGEQGHQGQTNQAYTGVGNNEPQQIQQQP